MNLTIKFYDVEHGSCTHIITPNGKHILVDIGSKTNSSIVKHIKDNYFHDGGTIDQLIITHPHEDHIWGIPDMYELSMEPRILCRPKRAFDIPIEASTNEAVVRCANKMNSEYSNPIKQEDDPKLSNNNGGVNIQVFCAPSETEEKKDLNTFSSVITVKYFDFKFVLTGDNPASILEKMVKEDKDSFVDHIKNATVLLAPHHGRENEFCKEFFDVVNPRLSVISDKRIVHGTQEKSSSLYKGRGVNLGNEVRYVYSTRNDGTITFILTRDGGKVKNSKDEYK